MELNHETWVDILKLKIESSQVSGLVKFISDFEDQYCLPVGQLLLTFCERPLDELHEVLVSLFEELEELALRLFQARPNPDDTMHCVDLSFMNMLTVHFYLKNADDLLEEVELNRDEELGILHEWDMDRNQI